MMNHRSVLPATFALCALLMFLGGCGSTAPSRFYLLSTSIGGEAAGYNGDRGLSIEIGPVGFPEYLDRQQIVVRAGPNELRLAEYHRWAEPLEVNFVRVLSGNLSRLLSTDRISVYPEKPSAPLAYRVAVDVMRFEGGPDGTVTLDAGWTLFKGTQDQAIHVQKSRVVTHAGEDEDYSALVSAKSDALGDLSREIADTIKDLEAKASR